MTFQEYKNQEDPQPRLTVYLDRADCVEVRKFKDEYVITLQFDNDTSFNYYTNLKGKSQNLTGSRTGRKTVFYLSYDFLKELQQGQF